MSVTVIISSECDFCGTLHQRPGDEHDLDTAPPDSWASVGIDIWGREDLDSVDAVCAACLKSLQEWIETRKSEK